MSSLPAPFVLVRPAALGVMAGRLKATADDLAVRAQRLEQALGSVTLNSDDPRLAASTMVVRSATVVDRLRRAAGWQLYDAEFVADTARRTVSADLVPSSVNVDGTGGIICRIPGRADDLADVIDPVLRSTLPRAATNLVHLADRWLPDDRRPVGDPAGTYSTRLVPLPSRARGDAHATPPAALLIADALAATGDTHSLRHDEFGLIGHSRRSYTVVLPGVVDLSDPQKGWHKVHRSVRDLDMAAIPSASSAAIDDNLYADMVATALDTSGVAPGADLLLVGHSFGADTALDLAADTDFADRYRIAGVVATGYYSQPQLRSVDARVPVLVLQSRRDPVVTAERLLPGPGNRSVRCPAGGSRGRHAVVEFDGGWAGLGHGPENYRAVFLDTVRLDPDDGVRVAGFVGSLSQRGFGPAAAMMAVDVSVP